MNSQTVTEDPPVDITPPEAPSQVTQYFKNKIGDIINPGKRPCAQLVLVLICLGIGIYIILASIGQNMEQTCNQYTEQYCTVDSCVWFDDKCINKFIPINQWIMVMETTIATVVVALGCLLFSIIYFCLLDILQLFTTFLVHSHLLLAILYSIGALLLVTHFVVALFIDIEYAISATIFAFIYFKDYSKVVSEITDHLHRMSTFSYWAMVVLMLSIIGTEIWSIVDLVSNNEQYLSFIVNTVTICITILEISIRYREIIPNQKIRGIFIGLSWFNLAQAVIVGVLFIYEYMQDTYENKFAEKYHLIIGFEILLVQFLIYIYERWVHRYKRCKLLKESSTLDISVLTA